MSKSFYRGLAAGVTLSLLLDYMLYLAFRAVVG